MICAAIRADCGGGVSAQLEDAPQGKASLSVPTLTPTLFFFSYSISDDSCVRLFPCYSAVIAIDTSLVYCGLYFAESSIYAPKWE